MLLSWFEKIDTFVNSFDYDVQKSILSRIIYLYLQDLLINFCVMMVLYLLLFELLGSWAWCLEYQTYLLCLFGFKWIIFSCLFELMQRGYEFHLFHGFIIHVQLMQLLICLSLWMILTCLLRLLVEILIVINYLSHCVTWIY